LDAIPVTEILPNVFRQPDEKGGGRIAGYFPVIIPREFHGVHSFERRQPRPSGRLIYREGIRVIASIKKKKASEIVACSGWTRNDHPILSIRRSNFVWNQARATFSSRSGKTRFPSSTAASFRYHACNDIRFEEEPMRSCVESLKLSSRASRASEQEHLEIVVAN